MSEMNYDGTVHADKVYVERQLLLILDMTPAQIVDYYKDGLRFFQRTRKQPRQIPGTEYHRYIERRLQQWPSEDAENDRE